MPERISSFGRIAVAKGRIRMSAETFETIRTGAAKKGDVLGVARVAGIMAAKRTSELIPLCHPLMLTKCTVDFELLPETLEVEAVSYTHLRARSFAVTGSSAMTRGSTRSKIFRLAYRTQPGRPMIGFPSR